MQSTVVEFRPNVFLTIQTRMQSCSIAFYWRPWQVCWNNIVGTKMILWYCVSLFTRTRTPFLGVTSLDFTVQFFLISFRGPVQKIFRSQSVGSFEPVILFCTHCFEHSQQSKHRQVVRCGFSSVCRHKWQEDKFSLQTLVARNFQKLHDVSICKMYDKWNCTSWKLTFLYHQHNSPERTPSDNHNPPKLTEWHMSFNQSYVKKKSLPDSHKLSSKFKYQKKTYKWNL